MLPSPASLSFYFIDKELISGRADSLGKHIQQRRQQEVFRRGKLETHHLPDFVKALGSPTQEPVNLAYSGISPVGISLFNAFLENSCPHLR